MTGAEDGHRVPATDVVDLCFTARALAQTHPMTEAAGRYRQERFEDERQRQPVSEIADWASTALLVGYCLRRAEEQAGGVTPASPEPAAAGGTSSTGGTVALSRSAFESGAGGVADSLRVGDPGSVTLLPPDQVVSALDRIIATELDKRNEHVREQLDDDAWAELEDYIAWWVVHGYGVRAWERPGP